MDKDSNVFLTASFIVIIMLLFAVGSMYMIKESEKDKRINLQKQVDSLLIEKQNLEIKLKDAEVANIQISSNIRLQEEKINALAKELEGQKTINDKNAAKLREKEMETQNLKDRIEEVRGERLDALKTLDRLNEAYLNLKFQLENLMKTKEELEDKAKEIAEKEGVSLGTVVIKRANE